MHSSRVPCRLLSFPGPAAAIFPLCAGDWGKAWHEKRAGLRAPFCSSPSPPPSSRPRRKKTPGSLATWILFIALRFAWFLFTACKGFADNFFSNLSLLLPPLKIKWSTPELLSCKNACTRFWLACSYTLCDWSNLNDRKAYIRQELSQSPTGKETSQSRTTTRAAERAVVHKYSDGHRAWTGCNPG